MNDEFKADLENASPEERVRLLRQYELVQGRKAELKALSVTARANKTIQPLFIAQDPETVVPTLLTYWEEQPSWSIHEAALLVTGYAPKTYRMYGGQEIAQGLDGGSVVGSGYFDSMRETLRLWNIDPDRPRIEGMPDRVRPKEFIEWCKVKGIDTGWFDEWEKTKPERAEGQSAVVEVPWIKYAKSQIDDIYLARRALGKEATKAYISGELVGRLKREGYVTVRRKPVSKDNILKFVLNDWKEPETE